MISKLARERAKQIKKERRKEARREREEYKEAEFMHTYHICPHCSNKIRETKQSSCEKFSYNCKSCSIKRNFLQLSEREEYMYDM